MPASPDAPGAGHDDPLLDRLLEQLQQEYWPPRSGAELAVGGPEIQFAIAVRDGVPVVEQVERGVGQVLGQFSDRASAYKYLILVLAEDLRSRRRWPRIEHRGTAPDTQLVDGDRAQRLTWPEGWAEFPPGDVGLVRARPFSWVSRVEPAQVVESYGHLNGEPLFDLGITDPKPWTDPAPRPTPTPRPTEPPPADPAGPAETESVLAAAAQIDWVRSPPGPADVLVVADPSGTGRAIGYRLGMFQYESVVGEWRKIRATFGTAAAARRFLALEASTIARSWRRQPVLRVGHAAPGWTVTKDPTEFVVSGPGVTATFPLGPIGQQNAVTFTYCAGATLDDIVASYRDPAGAPLFTSSG